MTFLAPLLSFSFWFSYHAKPFSPLTSNLLLIVGMGFVAIGVILLITKRLLKSHEARITSSSIAALLMTMGVADLFLWFVTYEGIPFLSMRIFWVLWLVVMIWWAYAIWRSHRTELANAVMSHDPEREAYEKYLPRPKKK